MITPSNRFGWLILVSLVALVLIPRLSRLGQFTTADEPRWQTNVAGFVTKLSAGRWSELVQQPHPGITLQWFAAPTYFSVSWTIRKIPLALWHGLLVLVIGYVVWRLQGRVAAMLAILLLAISPTLVAHSRVYAMDALLAEFFLLAVILLLLWRQTNQNRYLFFSGLAAAAAFWSKQPGLLLLPLSLPLLIWPLSGRSFVWPAALRALFIWLLAILLASIIILPSLALNPARVSGDLLEFFHSDEYRQVHQYSPSYYFTSLIFFTTPWHLLTLVMLIILGRQLPVPTRQTALTLLAFAFLFILVMTFGTKKGYRYILPSFVLFDATAAIVWAGFITTFPRRKLIPLLATLLLFQTAHLYRLHPYELAYINPLTRPWFGDRQLGWGEGLDLAAAYLNSRPNASQLKVASYYATQFSPYFLGQTVPLHQWDSGDIDYAILYRAMYGRAADDWETDVLHQFQSRPPERVIQLGRLDYAWIYRLTN